MPAWLAARVAELAEAKFSGELVVHFSFGLPVKWELRQVGKPEETPYIVKNRPQVSATGHRNEACLQTNAGLKGPRGGS